MKIYRVTDDEFKEYGRILEFDTSEILSEAEKISMPEEGSRYEASTPAFENLDIAKLIGNEYFGQLPTQIGYCWGYNSKMNAFEWHTGSEINIAVTDIILILGKRSELENGTRYNSQKAKAFLVKKGVAVEIYATSMHFCPCMTDTNGFGCVVALPAGTNTELETTPADELLFKKNKWIIAHEDNKALIGRGVKSGIYGENFDLLK